jgi:hypothetical protein
LLQADPSSTPIKLKRLITGCRNAEELELAAKLAAPQGSRFVFAYPDTVRLLLTRTHDLSSGNAVRETLLLSACGGGRSYSEYELDPEYGYIFEEAESLANRYLGDPFLEPFYRTVAQCERHQTAWCKRVFAEEDGEDTD